MHCDNSQGPAERSRLHLMNFRFAYSVVNCRTSQYNKLRLKSVGEYKVFFLLDIGCIYSMICLQYFWLICLL